MNEAVLVAPYLKEIVIDDFKLLKAFPFMIMYRTDIQITPEIIDHYIEHYYDNREFIKFIPLEDFSNDQKEKYLMKCLKNNIVSHQIHYFHRIVSEKFEFQYLILKAKMLNTFGELTNKQAKKVANLIFNKLSDSENINRIASEFDSIVYEKLFKIFETRFIKFTKAKNFIIAIRKSELSDANQEKFNLVMDSLLEKYPSLINNIVDNAYYGTMSKYISYAIKKHGIEYIVDKVLKENASIDKYVFKRLKKNIAKDSNAESFLLRLLFEHTRISTTMFNGVHVYKYDAISYYFMKVIEVVGDVFKFKKENDVK